MERLRKREHESFGAAIDSIEGLRVDRDDRRDIDDHSRTAGNETGHVAYARRFSAVTLTILSVSDWRRGAVTPKPALFTSMLIFVLVFRMSSTLVRSAFLARSAATTSIDLYLYATARPSSPACRGCGRRGLGRSHGARAVGIDRAYSCGSTSYQRGTRPLSSHFSSNRVG